MSSPISRTESPSLDEHSKRKRDERDAMEKQAGVLSAEAETEPEADPEAVPPKKIKPEEAEVKQIQRNLKTMPLEDNNKNTHSTHSQSKDMDDVESDQGSSDDQTQDKPMDGSSQQPSTMKTGSREDTESTPSSDAGDLESESADTTTHSTMSENNGTGKTTIHAITTSASGSSSKSSGFGNTSSVSPFASVKPGENVFGSSSSTLKGFSATSSVSPFGAAADKPSVFGSSSSSLSSGFGNTSSVSPFASMVSSTSVFGGDSSSKSAFGGDSSSKSASGGDSSSKSAFGGDSSSKSAFGNDSSSKGVFGGDSSSKSAFGSSSSTSTSGFGASAGNSGESTTGSVFGARSIVGSVVGATPSLQKTTSFPATSEPASSGSFSTFGAKQGFGRETSFTTGSFIDQEGTQEKSDFGSLLSQDVGEHDGDAEQQEGDDGFGTGAFTNADQIDVQTGEEDEISIYQTKGKLYADTEKTHSWKERGKGTFKINVDQQNTKLARLVMRADGVLRLILNVAIFPDMNVVITGDKYVRFIGIEDGHPIPFLLKVKDSTAAKEVVEGIRRATERQTRKSYAVTLKD